jgi:hypothetical protein
MNCFIRLVAGQTGRAQSCGRVQCKVVGVGWLATVFRCVGGYQDVAVQWSTRKQAGGHMEWSRDALEETTVTAGREKKDEAREEVRSKVAASGLSWTHGLLYRGGERQRTRRARGEQ